jgi:hypothetical protein
MKGILPAIALLVCTSCSTTPNTAYFDTTPRKPTSHITVFHENDNIPGAYREIGELSQEDYLGEDAAVLSRFVTQARAAGADGLIMLPGRDLGYIWNPMGRSGVHYIWRAQMIVWTDIKELGVPSSSLEPAPASPSTHPDAKSL